MEHTASMDYFLIQYRMVDSNSLISLESNVDPRKNEDGLDLKTQYNSQHNSHGSGLYQ